MRCTRAELTTGVAYSAIVNLSFSYAAFILCTWRQPMLSTPQLRISLWPVTGASNEQFVNYIHALAPDTQVGVSSTQKEICVYLEGETSTAVTVLDVLLQGELDTLVYSYHWYHVN